LHADRTVSSVVPSAVSAIEYEVEYTTKRHDAYLREKSALRIVAIDRWAWQDASRLSDEEPWCLPDRAKGPTFNSER
jgi:hypothetical protein